jgi:CBS domain-containing protein
MAQSIREVMTKDPVTLAPDAPIAEAARAMRDNDTGAILVSEGDQVRGLVTDRDIAVRAVADGRDPERTSLGEIATTDLRTVDADASVEDAIEVVRGSDVRRVPVVEDGKPVGIVSIGDLAIERDEESALADISSAPRNN